MGIQKINQVKQFVREALNLPDNCVLTGFAVKTDMQKLNVWAGISQEFNVNELVNPELKTEKSVKVSPVKTEKKNYNRLSISWKNRQFRVNPDDFKTMRVLLAKWRKDNLLTDEQVVTMTTYAGEFFKNMGSKRQAEFLDFFNSCKQTVISRNGHSEHAKETEDSGMLEE